MSRNPSDYRPDEYTLEQGRARADIRKVASKIALPMLGIVALGAVAAGLAEANHNSSQDVVASKINAEVKKDPEILNGKVIVSAGVKLRSGAELANNTTDSQSNVVGTVKPGEVTVFDHPLVYTDKANQEFIGGLDKEGDFVWVAASELQKQQQNADKTYIKFVMDENVGNEETHQGSFENGRFYYEGDQEHAPVATITSIPKSMEDQIVFDMK